ncbi:MAG: antibiotic biosynthesis monooxygenase [Bacteroidia bacterium]|nr:antibiotic biosynthesis monooxygenase [Bacteroidia bacterium]
MIERIVKMTFDDGNTDVFEKIFNEMKHKIANFEGCKSVKLLNDIHKKNIYFTYSVWENEKCLENYRHSELFKSTWEKTKQLFSEKPAAWSLIEKSNTQ